MARITQPGISSATFCACAGLSFEWGYFHPPCSPPPPLFPYHHTLPGEAVIRWNKYGYTNDFLALEAVAGPPTQFFPVQGFFPLTNWIPYLQAAPGPAICSIPTTWDHIGFPDWG